MLCVLSCSVMSDSETLWTVACQAPLSMRYWNRLPFRLSGDLPNSGTEPRSPVPAALQADSSPLRHWGFFYVVHS